MYSNNFKLCSYLISKSNPKLCDDSIVICFGNINVSGTISTTRGHC